MTDAVLVINAGSSSLKFSVFHIDGGALAPVVTGNLEELTGRARFRAGAGAHRPGGTGMGPIHH